MPAGYAAFNAQVKTPSCSGVGFFCTERSPDADRFVIFTKVK